MAGAGGQLPHFQSDLRAAGRNAPDTALPGAAFVSNMEAQAMLIRSGRFLGFLPVHFAESWVASGEMKELALPELRWHSEFCLAMRTIPAPHEVVRVFVDDLVSSLGLQIGGR
ncbi:LysR substrate-binding domain-containing protein [Oceanimonas sp. NS1]|nr:LysR substrate-binding domain-containing protein [Oceanimonas sp. NS1]